MPLLGIVFEEWECDAVPDIQELDCHPSRKRNHGPKITLMPSMTVNSSYLYYSLIMVIENRDNNQIEEKGGIAQKLSGSLFAAKIIDEPRRRVAPNSGESNILYFKESS